MIITFINHQFMLIDFLHCTVYGDESEIVPVLWILKILTKQALNYCVIILEIITSGKELYRTM